MAVMAGRARPGAIVSILDGEREIGRVTADAGGEWVFLPLDRFEPGQRSLSLTAQFGTGETMRSENVVVMVVPPRPALPKAEARASALATPSSSTGPSSTAASGSAAPAPPAISDTAGKPPSATALAVLLPRDGDGPARIVQSPSNSAGPAMKVIVDAVDYDTEGRTVIGGHATPGTNLRAYLDNNPVSDSRAKDDGNWSMVPTQPVPSGRYTLRVDQLRADGSVANRIELPFERAEPPPGLAEGGFIVVQPGNSLWRIARSTYGAGTRFTEIYSANQEQIRDPDLIYPGQVFKLP
jgi:nucleoid-associated protein YgaU